MAKSKIAAGTILAITLLVGSASYALRAKHASPGRVIVQFGALPLAFDGYRGEEAWFDEATYTVLRADTSTLRYYADASGGRIGLFAAYFGEQNYGEQIHSPRHCLPGGGWRILSHERVPVPIAGQSQIESNRMLIELRGNRQITYYYFKTRLGHVASEYKLKLALAQAALTFRPRDAVFVRVMVPVGPDGEAAADDRARQFLSASVPLLYKGLPL